MTSGRTTTAEGVVQLPAAPVEIRAIRPDRSWYALYLGAETKVFVMVVESHVGSAIERYLFGVTQVIDRSSLFQVNLV